MLPPLRRSGCLALAAAWVLSCPPCFADPPHGATAPTDIAPEPDWAAARRCRDVTQTEAEHTACVLRALCARAPHDDPRCRRLRQSLRRPLRPPAVRPDAPALPADLSRR